MAFFQNVWLHPIKRKAAKDALSRRRTMLTCPNQTVLWLEALEDRTVPSAPSLGPRGAYVETNLVSDIPGLALLTDASLQTPEAPRSAPTVHSRLRTSGPMSARSTQ
jgi:hypothetical protein